MSKSDKPWEIKENFIAALEQHGSWTEMARYYNKAGYKVSETTIRRWADSDKHNLRGWYLEDKLKKSQDEVKHLRAEIERLTKELDEPRTATPDELVAAERELIRANARVTQYKTIAQSLAKETNLMDDIKSHLEGVLDDV